VLDRVFELAVVVAVAVAVVTAAVYIVVGLLAGSWCGVADSGSGAEIRVDLVLVLIGMALFSLLVSLADYILERAYRVG
jgi:predicted Co/Zn/Cd cation transporter (cation efflux family)